MFHIAIGNASRSPGEVLLESYPFHLGPQDDEDQSVLHICALNQQAEFAARILYMFMTDVDKSNTYKVAPGVGDDIKWGS